MREQIIKSTKGVSVKVIKVLPILVLCMILTLQTVTAATSEESYAGNQLRILGILRGYDDGTLQLDNPIKRAEVAALTVRILGHEGVEIDGESRDFTDVDDSYWASDVIQNAYKLEIIQGYPDMTFKPLDNITYAEVVAIMVNALGKQEALEGEWPMNYIDRGKSIGVVPSSSNIDPKKVITRGEMAVIVWDTLLVKE